MQEILDIVKVAQNSLESGDETVREEMQKLITRILMDSQETDLRAIEEKEISSFAIDD